MRQPDKFISIAYQQIDFLIPNDSVVSSVGVKDLDIHQLQSGDAGIYDFDEIASVFKQTPRESEIKTMIVLRNGSENSADHISIVTNQECKVCTIPLAKLSLFSDFYEGQFKNKGLFACCFENNRIRLLIDVNKILSCMNDSVLEEL